MKASFLNPVYTVYIVAGTKKYNVTPAVSYMERVEAENEIAQRVNLELNNVQVDGVWLSSLLQPVNRVFVYADDGTKKDEVFRGFLWERNYKSSAIEQRLKVTAFDNLIYLQESEDTFYFTARKSTEEIISTICKEWGIKLEYSYYNITNGKLPLSGKLYDILTADILDETERHVGYYYSIISDKDTMYIRTAGSNVDTYRFVVGENVTSTSSTWTMEGVVTQVIVLGKAGEDEREPVQFVLASNAEKYGTLQKIYRRDEETARHEAIGEAQGILAEHDHPKWEYEIVAPDVPWIRKGDAIYVNAGDINDRRLIVNTVRRSYDLKNSKMTLTMIDQSEKAENIIYKGQMQAATDRLDDKYFA